MLANKLPENHLVHDINPHNSDYPSSVMPSPCCSLFLSYRGFISLRLLGLGGKILSQYKRSILKSFITLDFY